MELNDFVNRLILLLLPGIIAYKVYQKLRGRKTKKDWEDLVNILIFALLSYIVYGFCNSLRISIRPFFILSNYQPGSAFIKLIDNTLPIDWWEIIWSCALGIIIAYIASYISRYKLLNRFGQLIRATKRYGDEDVWDYFNNRDKVEWLVVRDHKTNVYYFGYIKVFSEDREALRELVLNDVSVYSSEGDHLYNCKTIYLARESSDLTIEIPDIPTKGNAPKANAKNTVTKP